MSLQDKYGRLLEYAEGSGVKNLSVKEEKNVLYVKGQATKTVKDYLWQLYQQADPDMRSGDLILDIEEIPGKEEIYEVKPGDNLSKIALQYPGMTWNKIYAANQDIIKDPDLIRPGQKIKIPL
ncbi:MAG: LysM peptidoglycan-binding domain-containing protein [Tannerellaceae bacterium]|nr:LysM peptidoglycan-binding domain-containing protein [Tannerellaceae bacterium]MCD7914359.1 LysM peptidoglycan-binding domain-containing protein [Tannerellaceae bacterium]